MTVTWPHLTLMWPILKLAATFLTLQVLPNHRNFMTSTLCKRA
jgi:hypothetical protein